MSEQLSNIQPVVGAHPTVTQAAEQAMEAFEHRPGHNVVGTVDMPGVPAANTPGGLSTGAPHHHDQHHQHHTTPATHGATAAHEVGPEGVAPGAGGVMAHIPGTQQHRMHHGVAPHQTARDPDAALAAGHQEGGGIGHKVKAMLPGTREHEEKKLEQGRF